MLHSLLTNQSPSPRTHATPRPARARRRTLGTLGLAGLLALTAGGCGSTGGFMDPSKVGRHKNTATIMPIMDRISSIEDATGDIVEYSDPLAEDLIPRPVSYRIGPGDVLQVTIFDIIEPAGREQYEVSVDPRGLIEIPQLGRIDVGDKTTEEAQAAIIETIKQRGLIQDPLVQVLAVSQRGQTYTIIGAIAQPGLYPIPRADYRILEALSAAGAFDESIDEIYIIRQIPLADEVIRGVGENREGTPPVLRPDQSPAQPSTAGPSTPPNPDQLIDLIEQIAPQDAPAPQPDAPKQDAPPPSPGMMARASGAATAARRQPPPQPAPERPLIDLIEDDPTRPAQMADGSSWIFVNGKWVRVRTPSQEEATTLGTRAEELITQRVIRVRLKDLLAGKQSINVVVRPGDVIRFPASASGFVWIGGEVARPGSYSVTPGLTLLRALTAAGGLGELAVPQNVDLTRKVGDDRQATIKLDLAAIAAQSQPDIYLRQDDMINVGTAPWALPLAVVRNGFRASYGFGFILDRNISNDLFGPPPTNQFGQ